MEKFQTREIPLEAQNVRHQPEDRPDFNAISLKLSSPERIRQWSYGEVTKAETINYRTGRSERGGLFDERIFGPEKDYECYCGKYRRIRYKGIICERCGVEVTRSIVRRERMGHIELASPVAHIWFVRGVPSRIGAILNLPVADVEKVIYFAGYIIISVNEDEKRKILKEIDQEYKNKLRTFTDERGKEKLKASLEEARRHLENLKVGKVIDEVAYHRLSLKYGAAFLAGIGAEALNSLLKEMDLVKKAAEIAAEIEGAGALERARLQKRYNVFRSMIKSGVRPEWMFLSAIPVIPPDLRPIVPLDGGRHATSDLNDLYRRVINRNNRLRKLQELDAPEVILRNEKRILQEAVDALIDNSMRRGAGAALNQAGRRPLKSLADNLKGKQGRFRQNLLGKRVDYSGRSVIVVGPNLALDQCGLPKHMALELFRPFVISKILEQELAYNIRGAGRLVDDEIPEVWGILEEVIKDKYVLLNRAPTLHRLSIQAFRPVLIEGSAIQIPPLVCTAFNADFDGDQMAVHVPLSAAAQKEAREIIAANKNILRPGNGHPIAIPKLDIILGSYWVTRIVAGKKGEGKFFADAADALTAYEYDLIDLRAKIKISPDLETSVGRILFNQTLPEGTPFVNKEITAKEMVKIIDDLIDKFGGSRLPEILDRIKNFGFHYATRSGITWGLDDIVIPKDKAATVEKARAAIRTIEDKYNEGLLSRDERYRMSVEIWSGARREMEKMVPASLDPDGPVMYMLSSGARGSISQIAQMAAMKGLIASPSGRLFIDLPIIPSYKEGLSPLEYFITTHGSRKTLTDTALNTAKAGYLTQRLVNVAQEVIVTENDCGEKEGKTITLADISNLDAGLANSVWGRVLVADVKSDSGKVLFKKGHLLTLRESRQLDEAGVKEVQIRTLLTCRSSGVCQQCYGVDLGRGSLVEVGEAIGIVAAQAIGEPGTQLTMRTKHSGGIDVGGDIVGGLPRVEEIFERRNPKHETILATADGIISEVKIEAKEKIITLLPAKAAGRGKKKESLEYRLSSARTVLVKAGDEVKAGQILTDGSANLADLYKLAGRSPVEEYIVREISNIYELQGASISRKHIEVIIRQMFSRLRIKEPGVTNFERGEIVQLADLLEENARVKALGGEEAKAETLLLGISDVTLNTSSFLASVSFQQSTKMLIRTAIRGGLDKLRGLKENVIIGRLIPAGTGLKPEVYEEKQAETNQM